MLVRFERFPVETDPDTGEVYERLGLVIGKTYEVLGIETYHYRIINEEGEPVLFELDCFAVVDDTQPEFWVTEHGEDGERYSYPPEWQGCFFERIVSFR